MSQTTTIAEKQVWVLVSSLKDDTKDVDLQMITQSVIELINEWQSLKQQKRKQGQCMINMIRSVLAY